MQFTNTKDGLQIKHYSKKKMASVEVNFNFYTHTLILTHIGSTLISIYKVSDYVISMILNLSIYSRIYAFNIQHKTLNFMYNIHINHCQYIHELWRPIRERYIPCSLGDARSLGWGSIWPPSSRRVEWLPWSA